MPYRLIWVTDPHLEFLRPGSLIRAIFCGELSKTEANSVLITGDISNAAGLKHDLQELQTRLNKPVHFVLGNHDFYGGTCEDSIRIARDRCKAPQDDAEQFTYLSEVDYVRLTETTLLVGVDGFADGLGGSGSKTKARIMDFFHIQDLFELSNDAERFEWMHKRVAKETTELRRKLIQAAFQAKQILIATHVPPFIETSFHEGKPSDAEYLPFFSCPTMGQMLLEVATQHRDREFHVLCGHTHSPAPFYRPLPNLTVETAGAEYHNPKISRILEL